MNERLAADVIGTLTALSQDIHRPLEDGVPALSEQETRELDTCITDVWGSFYFELMGPLIATFPHLDPDSHTDAKDSSLVPSAHSPSAVAREEFGRALEEAAEEVGRRLESLVAVIEANAAPVEAWEFKSHVCDSIAKLSAVKTFAQGLRRP
jgi:hypothetical protein